MQIPSTILMVNLVMVYTLISCKILRYHLILVMLGCIVMGMGVPTGAAYLIIAIVLGPALETGVWANYHDLLGEESGHLLNSEVVTLNLHMQFRDDSFELTQFQLFNIQKYALNPTGISGDFDWSWRTRAGWERENLGCFPCRKFLISGGKPQSKFSICRFHNFKFLT